MKNYTVTPGDLIGRDEGGVNFSTGYSVVDVMRITLAAASGCY